MYTKDLTVPINKNSGKTPKQKKEEFSIALGNHLAQKRESMNLGQRDLAWKFDPPKAISTISRWENAAVMPDVYSLYQLANIFGCSCDELISGSSTPHGITREHVLSYIEESDFAELSDLLGILQKKLSAQNHI